jgi:hypothetical protein
MEKPDRETPLAIPRNRWENYIKMDIRVIGWEGIDWTDLVQDRDRWRAPVRTIIKLRLAYTFGKFLIR